MTIETQEKCPDCLRPTNSADGTADPFCLRAWSGGKLGVEVCLKLTVARLRADLAEDEEAMRGLVEFLDGGTRCFHCDEAVPPEEQEHWRHCEKHPAKAALAAAQGRIEGLEDLAYDLGLLLIREREYTEALARQHLFDLDDAEAFRLNDLLLAIVKRMKESGIGPDTALKRASSAATGKTHGPWWCGGSDNATNHQPKGSP